MGGGFNMRAGMIADAEPEVMKAIDEVYKPDQPFVNTKRVVDHILENKKNYPLLSVRIHKVVAQIVTTTLRSKNWKMYTSEKHTRRYGRVFIRVIPSENHISLPDKK